MLYQLACRLCRQNSLNGFGNHRTLFTRFTKTYHTRTNLRVSRTISSHNGFNKKTTRSFQRLLNLQKLLPMRNLSNTREEQGHKSTLIYLTSAAILVGGLAYATVPLYRLYCQASGYGSATQEVDFGDKIEEMERAEDRVLTIRFEAGTSKTLRWKFKPQQKEVKVAPGETALAFYSAENLTDEPIIGIATYNVIPFEAGQYFNKIQCFCFEEQQLNPNEEVDMPVFFYIDPDFTEDPKLAKYDELILSYTFFQSNEANAPGVSPH